MGLDIVNPPPAFLFVPTIVVFDASTTWVVPPGVSKVYGQLWGGGGSGGASGVTARAGNGGGGEYRAGTIVTSPGESLIITVGLGGAGVPESTDGHPGGDTNIKRGGSTLLEAKGGGPGLQGSGSHGAGGTGGTGSEGIDGQYGGSGGSSPKGGWGSGATGQPPGGGSLGANSINSSGDGAHGRIVIMYWQPA